MFGETKLIVVHDDFTYANSLTLVKSIEGAKSIEVITCNWI